MESPKFARWAKSDKLVLELEDRWVPIIEEAMERMMLSWELDLLIVDLGVRDSVDENDSRGSKGSASPVALTESFAARETIGTSGRDAIPSPRSGEEGSSSFLGDTETILVSIESRAAVGYACIISGVEVDEDASSALACSMIRYFSLRLVRAIDGEITVESLPCSSATSCRSMA